MGEEKEEVLVVLVMVGVRSVIVLVEVWVGCGFDGWEVLRWRGVSGACPLLGVLEVEGGCVVEP